MANIIDTINEIGEEVRNTLQTENSSLYYQETSLLYSLAENLLKYLVATKKCWDINCQLVDELEAKKANGKIVSDEEYYFDGEKVRNQIKKIRFVDAIDSAHSLGLITKDLRDRLDVFRQERNSLIHELYLFHERNNEKLMKQRLINAEAIVSELVPVFENLIFNEIGVDIDEVLETL